MVSWGWPRIYRRIWRRAPHLVDPVAREVVRRPGTGGPTQSPTLTLGRHVGAFIPRFPERGD